MNSLLTSARTSTDDGVNPIPAFEADGAVRPADLEPELSPTAVGVGDHGRRDGDVEPSSHAPERDLHAGDAGRLARPADHLSDPHHPTGGKGGGRPFEAQGRPGRGQRRPCRREGHAGRRRRGAIRHALHEPGLGETPDLVGTHPGRHPPRDNGDNLPGSSNETSTLAAGRPLTSTTPLAWNVAIPHLRDCRGGVYDGAAAEVSGRGESAHPSCRRGPSMPSAEADALRSSRWSAGASGVGGRRVTGRRRSRRLGVLRLLDVGSHGIDLGDGLVAGRQHVELAAELGELVRHRGRLAVEHQRGDGRLAVLQRAGDLVVLGAVDPEVPCGAAPRARRRREPRRSAPAR